MPDAPAGPPNLFLERDLRCLTCGYNLRGLGGERIRCPECGDYTSVRDWDHHAQWRAKQRAQQLQWIAGAVLAGFLLVLGSLAVSSFSSPFALVMAGAGVASSGLGAIRFRRACAESPGWLTALLWHMLLTMIGVLSGLTVLAGYIFSLVVSTELLTGGRAAGLQPLLEVLLALGGLAIALVLLHILSSYFTRISLRPLRRVLLRAWRGSGTGPETHGPPEGGVSETHENARGPS